MASRNSALQTIFSGEELPSPASTDVIKSGWLSLIDLLVIEAKLARNSLGNLGSVSFTWITCEMI